MSSSENEKGRSTGACPELCYFHILWDHELDDLHQLLERITERRDQVIKRWYDLYMLHFGHLRALPEKEFFDIYGSELDAFVRHLLQRNMEGFAAVVRESAERLAERSVPYAEVIVSMHLFEESVASIMPVPDALMPRVYLSFDKLSHIRTIILAETYFRSRSAAAEARILDLEREAAPMGPTHRSSFRGLVGASPMMRRLYERIEAAGATRGTILIVGESGTGKELVARAIHEAGGNPSAPFLPFNCAAIPRELIESELFGYKRGAFSGAAAEYLGLFRAAEGGTLFLDEITEMAPETQSKLLRAVQERAVRPVGSTREIPFEVRLIASTNRDPAEAVRSGRLRDDLYYRLQANVLRVPPLRERLEDLPLLITHFIALFNEKHLRRSPLAGIDDDALEAMRGYQWPGNVREVANAIEGAFTFGRDRTIRLEDLPAQISGNEDSRPSVRSLPVGTFANAEREIIRRALEATGWNKLQAAKLLRVSRKKLYAKIAKYGLSDDTSKDLN